jgi:hypothetical protein
MFYFETEKIERFRRMNEMTIISIISRALCLLYILSACVSSRIVHDPVCKLNRLSQRTEYSCAGPQVIVMDASNSRIECIDLGKHTKACHRLSKSNIRCILNKQPMEQKCYKYRCFWSSPSGFNQTILSPEPPYDMIKVTMEPDTDVSSEIVILVLLCWLFILFYNPHLACGICFGALLFSDEEENYSSDSGYC